MVGFSLCLELENHFFHLRNTYTGKYPPGRAMVFLYGCLYFIKSIFLGLKCLGSYYVSALSKNECAIKSHYSS